MDKDYKRAVAAHMVTKEHTGRPGAGCYYCPRRPNVGPIPWFMKEEEPPVEHPNQSGVVGGISRSVGQYPNNWV